MLTKETYKFDMTCNVVGLIRECKWFTKKDIEKWLKQEDKILKSFDQTFNHI